jgi:hypothetical protein
MDVLREYQIIKPAEAAARRAAYEKNGTALFELLTEIYRASHDQYGTLLPSIRPAALRDVLEHRLQPYYEAREDARDAARVAWILANREEVQHEDV